MISPAATTIVSIAFSSGADVVTWAVSLSVEQVERLSGVLSNLLELGQVAGFSLKVRHAVTWDKLIAHLTSRCGSIPVELSLGLERHHIDAPAFLMPVWPFDHEIGGAPAAVGRLLGLDLELVARPSPDEEVGAFLPGRTGLWLIHARPMF